MNTIEAIKNNTNSIADILVKVIDKKKKKLRRQPKLTDRSISKKPIKIVTQREKEGKEKECIDYQ